MPALESAIVGAQEEKGLAEKELTSDLELFMEKEVESLATSGKLFIAEQLAEFGFSEKDPIVTKEIERIQQKYKAQKKSLGAVFLKLSGKVFKYVSATFLTAAIVARLAKQELPSYLDQEVYKTNKEITWNPDTRAEIYKLAHEYSFMTKKDNRDLADVPSEELQRRFLDFVSTFAPNIKIIHPTSELTTGEEIGEWIFKDVFSVSEKRAHYRNNKLFYVERNLKMTDDSTDYELGSSSLGDFTAEVAHHINEDWSLARSFAYADDFISHGFQQDELYGDPYSSEYQAHKVTEKAIRRYLSPKKEEMKYSFVAIYNMYQAYYRTFTELSHDKDRHFINYCLFRTVNPRTADYLIQNQNVIFENIHDIDLLIKKEIPYLDKKRKTELFEHILSFYNQDLYKKDFIKRLSGSEILKYF